MSKNTVVSLTLQIKGNAGQQLKQISDQQLKAVKQINTESERLRPIQAQQVASAKTYLTQLKQQGDALVKQTRDAKNLDTIRKSGIRTEQQIKTEIQQSQVAYQKLTILQRQGLVTVKDTERAYTVMKSRVAALNAELGKTVQKEKQIQQAQRQSSGLGNRFQGAVATGGALAAGGMVLSNAMQKPRDYAQLMTYVTATATGGQGLSLADRTSQGKSLEQYVKDAVRTGGGTREDAAAALNELIASGKYDVANVKPALNASTRTAFAAGAETVDAAKMTIAMQNFGVKDIYRGQERSVRAGQLGSFEYRDMAKFLPDQMAMARAFGYSGDEGLVKLLALNQMSKTTTADNNQAGNNVVNLLQKLSSRELKDTLADKVENTNGLPTKAKLNKKGKVIGQEFDWTTYSIQQREQGLYGVEAFVKLLEHQLAGNKQYTQLQTKAKNAGSDEERKALLDDMSNIAMGSSLGDFLADRQALLAAMAAVYNKGTAAKLEGGIANSKGTIDSDLEFIQSQEWAKDQAVTQEKLFAQSKMYDAVSGVLGGFKDKVAVVAQENEKLAAAAYGAAIALGAVAVAGTAGTVLGGGKGGAIAGKVGGLARAGGAALTKAGPAGAVAGAGVAGYAVGSVISEQFVEGTAFGDKLGEKLVKIWATFGNEEAKAAVAAQQAYDQMLSEQARSNQLSAELSNKIGTLINVTRENKPIPLNLNGLSLAQSFGKASAAQENRHGAAKPFMLQHTGR